MINIKHLIVNAKSMYPLMEDSFSQLKQNSDAARQSRSVGMSAKFDRLDQGQHGHARTHWKIPSQSGNGTYDAVVEIHVPSKGGLFALAKGKWDQKKFSRVLANSNVKVHCSCPDFYWSGMKYNLGPAGKYKGNLSPNQNAGHKGEPNVVANNLAPDNRDPDRKHVLCKHLLSVFRVFPFNASTIMSQAKKFDNNIMINDEIAKDLDQGRRALGKDIELIEVSDEEQKNIIDPVMDRSSGELEKDQENQGSEEIIQNRDEPEEIQREIPDETEDIIDEENTERKSEEVTDTTSYIIDEENEEREVKKPLDNETEDIIEEENNSKKVKPLEKDKDIDSDVSGDVNDLLGK